LRGSGCDTFIGFALITREAIPVTALGIEEPVCGRQDLLTMLGDLPESPVALPMPVRSDQRSVLGSGGKRTDTVRAAIPGDAAPLPLINFDTILAGRVVLVLDAKAGYLLIAVVTRPPLRAGDVM
jgi:hypothetical protein